MQLLSDQSVELLSLVRLFATPWTAARQASLSITNFWSLLKLMSIKLVMPSNRLILCCLLPSIFPSIRIFSNESALRIKWPKYQSFNFSINPSNECSGLISFRIDSFDLLAVQVLSDGCFYKRAVYYQIMEFGYTVKTQLFTATRRPK